MARAAAAGLGVLLALVAAEFVVRWLGPRPSYELAQGRWRTAAGGPRTATAEPGGAVVLDEKRLFRIEPGTCGTNQGAIAIVTRQGRTITAGLFLSLETRSLWG